MMPASRSRLLSLLSEACELEHGLACSYLYAAFSIKQDLSEGGLTWRQLQQIRRWASEIYMVAAEEMLHLAQAWNILAAVGGSPYYMRPNFPQKRTYYGFDLPLALEPFGLRAIDRFIKYETPSDLLPPRPATADENSAEFRTVGELYELIADQISKLPESDLFFAGSQGEIGADIAHFPGLLPVRGADDARKAIRLIVEQGEGLTSSHENSHYAVFRRMRDDLCRAMEDDPVFSPARRVIDNPVPRIRDDWASGGPVNLMTNPLACKTADLFDDAYTLMLRLLQHAFASGPSGVYAKLFAGAAIDAMTTVLKPLGEALTLLPSGLPDNSHAGASFGLTRHVPLAERPGIARTVAAERMNELADVAAMLAKDHGSPRLLSVASDNLSRIGAILSPDA